MNKKIAVLVLAVMPFGIFACKKARIADNIDLPFVNDPGVIGEWVSVDFVKEPSLFTAGRKSFEGDLYLTELTFLPEGKLKETWVKWTKDVIINSSEKTASAYIIKDIAGGEYMFFEWKSGDYVFRRQKPWYYVMKKK